MHHSTLLPLLSLLPLLALFLQTATFYVQCQPIFLVPFSPDPHLHRRQYLTMSSDQQDQERLSKLQDTDTLSSALLGNNDAISKTENAVKAMRENQGRQDESKASKETSETDQTVRGENRQFDPEDIAAIQALREDPTAAFLGTNSASAKAANAAKALEDNARRGGGGGDSSTHSKQD
ncbi:MAG: hypothetical protein DHS80DRAFT_25145 [Piptocephalis tieghemiana]|nr:MAG: hypothetical protein DHS80DRAFT_25145 [Piptocephalis tieghemiana]